MSQELTFGIIKPNAVKKQLIGKILAHYEETGFTVAAGKLIQIPPSLCETFYGEHKSKPFFGELVSFMTSGPVFVFVLAGENAVTKNRTVMGATNPVKAEPGTLRALYGDSLSENSVHGSDSLESAQREIGLFFSQGEIVNPSVNG